MPKNILSSTLPLLAAFLLFLFVGKYGVGRVVDLRDQISQANTEKTTLTTKVNNLRSLSANLGTTSLASSVALPDKNPALTVLSQMKTLAVQNLVTLSDVKSGAGARGAGGLSSASLILKVSGPRQAVLSFLQGVGKIAPITLINKISYDEIGVIAEATINLTSFWAPLPTKIPALDQPVNTLTPDEQKILGTVTSLIQPQFTQVSPSTGGKADPFTQVGGAAATPAP